MTNSAKPKGSKWISVGSIQTKKSGKEGFTLYVKDTITIPGGSYLNVTKFEDEVTRKLEKGFITEDEATEQLQKFHYIKYNVTLPPPSEK